MIKQYLIGGLIIFIVFSAPIQEKVNNKDLQQFGVYYDREIYSGYLPISDDDSMAFHYFFYPTEQNQPIILWLHGGPGCSSLQGAFAENGPFIFKENSTEWMNNTQAWTNFASMFYLESPAGVGFSYGDITTNDTLTAQHNLKAVVEFFAKFPEQQHNDFFVTGVSYAGIYVPTLAYEIIKYNQNPFNDKVKKINLIGIAVGNGCTDPTECSEQYETFPVHILDYYGKQNLISQQLYDEIKKNKQICLGSDSDFCKNLTTTASQEISNQGSILWNPYNVYGYCWNETFQIPDTNEKITKKQPVVGSLQNMNGLGETISLPPCDDEFGFYYYLRNKRFMNAIHINDKSPRWNFCSSINYTVQDEGSYYLYPLLIKANLKILKFSGDIDSVVPITGTLFWLNKLQNEFNIATKKAWRPWFKPSQRKDIDDKQNAGNVWELDGITFASIRYAGHMVTSDQREAAAILIKSFINNEELPYLK